MTTVKLQVISKSAPPLFASLAAQESFHQQVVFESLFILRNFTCNAPIRLSPFTLLIESSNFCWRYRPLPSNSANL